MRDRFDYYARLIAERLSCRDCFESYGFEVNRHGYTACPFHSEKTPSLKVWPDHWKCFGCGAHGDNITLVQKLFSLGFADAIKKLNADFGLGIDIGDASLSDVKRFKKEQTERRKKQIEAEKQREAARQVYYDLVDEEIRLRVILRERRPKEGDEELDPVYAAALWQLPLVSHLLNNFNLEGGPAG